jgi:hypothetical protein
MISNLRSSPASSNEKDGAPHCDDLFQLATWQRAQAGRAGSPLGSYEGEQRSDTPSNPGNCEAIRRTSGSCRELAPVPRPLQSN